MPIRSALKYLQACARRDKRLEMFVMSQAVKAGLSDEQGGMLISIFGDRLQRFVSLARFTAARIGGAADWLIVAESADQLVDVSTQLWALDIPFFVLGGGSNVLVRDSGVRDVVILNKARYIHYDLAQIPPVVWAESGANFGLLARQCAQRGLRGLEWAAGIPGTVGGAVFGNAGAHGSDMAGSMQMAEILHRTPRGAVREHWSLDDFEFEYRSSKLKRIQRDAIILTAKFQLRPGESDEIKARMDEFATYRRETQPPGASMGSMFKNPPDDYAGRLIEEAGLKGTRIGGAEISPVHANFFVNHENATASDVIKLIRLAKKKVFEKFGVDLELEIELIGES
jgi:UDP-N-acetylmuramate dehydrogenase